MKTIQLCFFIDVLIVLVFYVVLLCVFTFLIPQCDVPFEFHIKTMFGSSLSLVVCRRNHVLVTLFIFFTYSVVCFSFYVFVLCTQMLPVSLDCPFFFIPSVFRYRRLYQSSKAQNVDFFLFYLVCRSFLCQHIF